MTRLAKRILEKARKLQRKRRHRSFHRAWRPGLELLESRTLLTTLTVNSLADDVTINDGLVTLREAIIASNNDLMTDLGEIGSGADNIVFAPGLNGGTIALTQGELFIIDAVTISGLGASQTIIDAQQNSRIFSILGTAADVMLDGLTLTGGRTTGNNASFSDSTFSGGAIRFDSPGVLTIRNSTVSENSTAGIEARGGGIFAIGDVTLIGSVVSMNSTSADFARGGGIFAIGDVALTDSTVSQNSTAGGGADGGGIFAGLFGRGGNVTLTDSNVSQNSTIGQAANGGGIYAEEDVTLTGSTVTENYTVGGDGSGGGILGRSEVTLTNSTVSANSTAGDFAFGGGIRASADVSLTNSTVSQNSTAGNNAGGGGIYAGSDVTLTNSTIFANFTQGADAEGGGIYAFSSGSPPFSSESSIIAGNRSKQSTNPDLLHSPSSPLTLRNSLIGNNAGTVIGALPVGSPDANGNLVGTASNPIRPRLAPLSFLGGPTPVHALLPGSPALDAGGNPLNLSFDQRGDGFVRTLGSRTDIGAFEGAVAPFALVVTTADDELDTVFDADDLSLREAIEAANLVAGRDLITFAPGLSGRSIALTLGELVIGDGVRITGLGASQTILDAQQNSRIFNILGTAGDVTLNGLTLTGGRTTGSNASSSDSTFSGGAIRSASPGLLTIQNSIVTRNSTLGNEAHGGGIYADGLLNLLSSTVSENFTSGTNADGGGLFGRGTTFVVDSTLSANSTLGSSADGGAIFVQTNLSITGSVVSENAARGDFSDGGAVFVIELFAAGESTFSGNSATGPGGSGGAIFADGIAALTNSTVSHNSASGSGGGIRALGDVTLTGTSVSHNSTADLGADGGGIFSTADVTLTRSTVSNNSTAGEDADGGGVFTVRDVILMDSTVSENSTAGDTANGGGIFAAAAVTLTNSTVSQNSTAGRLAGGGGIRAADVTLTNSTVFGNFVAGESARGGGVFLSSGSFVSDSSIVAGNRSERSTSPDLRPPFGDSVTVRNSLIGSNADTALAAAPVGSPDANGNLIGAAGNPIDPRLTPLGNFGGPTLTHALLPGSPAIDAGGNPFDFEFDQRGADRAIGPRTDIGAYEFQIPTVVQFLVVTTTDDEIDLTFDPADLSLREAIHLANQMPGLDPITIAPQLSGQRFDINLGELILTDTISITGLGADNTIIDAQQQSRIFNVLGTAGDVWLDGLTLTGGRTTGNNASSSDSTSSGGAIRFASSGVLTIANGGVSESSTAGAFASGGAVFAAGDVRLDNGTISQNSTVGEDAQGGGIFALGTVTLTNSTVSRNSTTGEGGALGGGIFSLVGVNLTDSSLTENSTAGTLAEGGGIYSAGFVSLLNSTLWANSTTGNLADGGGVFVEGEAVIINSTLSGNFTTGNNSRGGGLAILDEVGIANSTIFANFTTGTGSVGGGIFIVNAPESVLDIESSIIAGNRTQQGLSPDIHQGANPPVVRTSLIGNGDGAGLTAAPVGSPDANGNIIGAADDPIHPRLSPLTFLGGPTPVHALLPGSPAFDAGGNPLNLSFDQRGDGFVRTLGSRTDIGAFEGTVAPFPLVVTTTDDELDSVFDADDLSLREAVALAGFLPGPDTISFDAALVASGDAVIELSVIGATTFGPTALRVSGDITISGPAGEHGIAIRRDAGVDNLRLFHVTDTGNLTLEFLTLSGGRAVGGDGGTAQVGGGGGGAGLGGAIFNEGHLTIIASTLTANQAIGGNGGDGGTNSNGDGGAGGGPNGGQPAGQGGFGGGGGGASRSGGITPTEIPAADGGFGGGGGGGGVTVGNIIFFGAGRGGFGSGIESGGGGGGAGLGGAIFNRGGRVQLTNSTVSANATAGGIGGTGFGNAEDGQNGSGYGGGLYNLAGDVRIDNSTLTDNSGTLVSSGGSIYSLGFEGVTANLTINNSIVANSPNGVRDVFLVLISGVTSSGENNLIERQMFFQGGIVSSDDPQLGPLQDNGGPTPTHALLPGSPAIDAGDPAFDPNTFIPPLTADQSGQQRVRDGNNGASPRIDIGAYEFSSFLFGDLDRDGVVGLRDVATLQRNLAATDATYAQGDLNADGRVDRVDAAALALHFGNRLLPAGAPSAAAAVVTQTTARSVSAARPASNDVESIRPISREGRRRSIAAASVDRAIASTVAVSSPPSTAIKLRARRRSADAVPTTTPHFVAFAAR